MGLREGEPLRHGALSVWRHVGRESGATAMSLRVLEVQPGTSPGLLNGDCEEVLFVLEGRGTAYIDGGPHAVDADTGVFVPPRACLTIVNPGTAALTLVSAQCPDPGSQLRLVEPLLRPAAPSRDQGGGIARLWEREARPSGDRWYRVLVDERMGSTQVTQFVGAIPPGRAPDHFHEYEEVLCFLAGEGRLWAGEASAPVGPGRCAFLPRGQVHCTENTGTAELRLLGVFHPSGSPAVSYTSGGARRK